MIPPDYTALEMKARFYASRRRASGGYTLAEFLEESADALALAASLQDEIERLRKYARHAEGCTGGYDTRTCTCGLAPETGDNSL